MKLYFHPYSAMLCLVFLNLSCGLEVGNPQQNPVEDPKTTKMAGDSEFIQSQMDTFLSLTQNEADNNSDNALYFNENQDFLTDLSLLDAKKRECVLSQDSKSMVYTFSNNDEENIKRIRKGQNISFANTRTVSATTTWTANRENVLLCLANLPIIKIRKVADLKVVREFSLEKARNIDNLPSALQSRMAKSLNKSIEGTYTINQVKLMNATGFELERTISLDSKETLKLVYGNGSTQDLVSQISLSKPLKLSLQIEDGQLSSRKIIEGTQVITATDGRKLEINYQNLNIEKAEGCTPLSGNIVGKIVENDGITIGESFTITFSEGNGVINYEKSGDVDEYTPDCKLFNYK